MKRRNAFTLIELLVVVAIIVVLIAILLPSLGRAKAQAEIVTCQSNLRMINMGMRFYAEDNQGLLPAIYYHDPSLPSGDSLQNTPWYFMLSGQDQYSQQVVRTDYMPEMDAGGNYKFQCPTSRKALAGSYGFCYGMNSLIVNVHASAKLQSFENPAATILTADGCKDASSNWYVWAIGFTNFPLVDTNASYPNTAHLGGACYNFIDGHGEYLPALYPEQLNSAPKGQGTSIFFIYPER